MCRPAVNFIHSFIPPFDEFFFFAEDMLLFRFTHIDPVEPEKEFNIVLDVSSRTYRGEHFGFFPAFSFTSRG